MDLGAAIHSSGGPVLFVWAWLQGEAAVIVGGALAAAGYWPWWAVSLIAMVPATLGHQIYFAVGRRYGEPVLERLPARWHPAIERARMLVRTHDSRVMLLMRFAYGIRLPLPILCGVARIEPSRFLLYNVGTGLGWALLFTWIGYVYGAATTALLGHVMRAESWILLGALTLGVSAHWVSHRIGRKLTR